MVSVVESGLDPDDSVLWDANCSNSDVVPQTCVDQLFLRKVVEVRGAYLISQRVYMNIAWNLGR